MIMFRIYYEVAGGHVHCRFFAGKNPGSLGKCGDFTMRKDEFDVFMEAAKFIQFREERR